MSTVCSIITKLLDSDRLSENPANQSTKLRDTKSRLQCKKSNVQDFARTSRKGKVCLKIVRRGAVVTSERYFLGGHVTVSWTKNDLWQIRCISLDRIDYVATDPTCLTQDSF